VRQPDFFIVGAPKCGTTALSEYLRGHSAVFVSTPKEPHYFCEDFDYYYRPGERSLEHYLRLFDDAGPGHAAVGEASVWYLYSERAVPAILEFAPSARIVAMVRDPVEMVPSLHSQMRYAMDEDVDDVETAWRLQDARAEGRSIPPTCRVPEFLQYRRACALGWQIQRLMATVPPEQLRVIVLDDLRRDARAVYLDTLGFLGVPDDGRTDFPRVNANKVHRAGRLARLTQRPPRALVRAAEGVKRVTGRERLGVLQRVRERNRSVEARSEPSPEFLAELREFFADDVALLERLLDRDLGWK
jgi:hypothetical protein